MFALGVGPGIDAGELLNIAGDSDRVFRATSYDELDAISNNFSQSVLGTCFSGKITCYQVTLSLYTSLLFVSSWFYTSILFVSSWFYTSILFVSSWFDMMGLTYVNHKCVKLAARKWDSLENLKINCTSTIHIVNLRI